MVKETPVEAPFIVALKEEAVEDIKVTEDLAETLVLGDPTEEVRKAKKQMEIELFKGWDSLLNFHIPKRRKKTMFKDK